MQDICSEEEGKVHMNIVVTGGAGFIGSHLCEALIKQGHRVYVIDNLNSYYSPEIKRENLQEVFNVMNMNGIPIGNFIIFEGDIRNQELLNEVLGKDIDLVIHLAAMAGVRYSIENPSLYYDVNVIGTLKILESCRLNNINKFIFASSSSVYGNNTKVPFSEEDKVDNPISPYAATKKSGELLCYTYHKLYNISTACLRFFTVYGPRQRPDLAIHKFANLIKEDKEILFFGDGTAVRDYTYISDIIDGITRTISWLENSVGEQYDIFNLGESRKISLHQMVNTLETALKKKARKKLMPMQPGDVNSTYADITKARNLLGYNPTYDFEEGIKEFVLWLGHKG